MSQNETIWQKRSRAGKIGARIRYKLYGNPGTPIGRCLGGTISSLRQRKLCNSPFSQRKIYTPRYSSALAECTGIILGDGGITNRQLYITLHKKDDLLYSKYVISLLSKLFKSPITVTERSNVLIIIISRTKLIEFLSKIGLRAGNKVRDQASVPKWISNKKIYIKKCIRGLVDTDGCLYVDNHLYKKKTYKNIGLNFTNRSLPLLYFVRDNLLEMGYDPTQSTKFSIFLRKEKDVFRYMKEIGTSNKKLENKLKSFILYKQGIVPKRS